jgi:hypothetical protein
MMLKLAANISGDKLVSLGTCFGKFTKTHKFRLHVTALDYLAPYAKVRCGGLVSRLPSGMKSRVTAARSEHRFFPTSFWTASA